MPAAPTAVLRTVRDVAIGGAIGALMRTAVTLLVVAAVGGDLAVVVLLNLLGTFLLARLVLLGRDDPRWVARAPLLGTGLFGSLTTFSGLVVPLAVLADGGRLVAAVAWGVGSLAVGIWVAARVLGEPPA